MGILSAAIRLLDTQLTATSRRRSGPPAVASPVTARHRVHRFSGTSRRRPALFVVVLVLALALPAAAQSWKGTGRVSGVVRDEAGEPVAGASVLLRWGRDPEAGPPEVATDEAGRWAVLGVAPGPWLLTVRAEGYRHSTGTVEVRQGPSPPLEVTLVGLVVQTPSSSEGRLETVTAWIAAGNSLLEQGEWAAARAEYEKVLRVVEGPGRAEVLSSVARTHYMEGDVDRAIERLEEAVLAAPGDETIGALYRMVMGTQGRTQDAEAFLADVAAGVVSDAEAPGSVGGERGETLGTTGRGGAHGGGGGRAAAGEESVEAPLRVEAMPGRRGAYTTAFDEHHPLAGIEVYAERFDYALSRVERADPAAGRYDLAGESFRVFVPKGYESTGEWGLFVWVSPTPDGGVPAPGARAALAENRLIWVGADDSGNQRLPWNRVGLALDAAHNAQRYYELAPERVYVGGYSGGGRIATALTLLYPEVFRGGLFVYGVDFYRRVPVPDRPGSDWIPWFPVPERRRLDELSATARLVLVTGERDFNRLQTEIFAREYREEGFRHVTYLEIPGAGHYDWPPRQWLSRAMAALEGEGL